MPITTPTTTMRVRVLDWTGRMNGAHELVVLTVEGTTYLIRDDLVVDGAATGAPIDFHVGPEEGLEGLHPEVLPHVRRECRVFALTDVVERTPFGDLPVVVPLLVFDHPARQEGGEVGEAMGLALRMVLDPSYRPGIRTDFTVAAGAPTAPRLPDPPPWVALDAMVGGARPLCEGCEGEPCGREVDVAWRHQTGVEWSCAWHWPARMVVRPTPVVFAVWCGDRWATWRDTGEWDLWSRACDAFAAVVDATTDRPHLPPEDRPALREELYGWLDHERAAVHWAVSLTHPGRPAGAVLEALSVVGVPLGRPYDFCWVPLADIGLRAFAAGDQRWGSGDHAGAVSAWTAAANGCDSSESMGRLAELAVHADDPEAARAWWTRSARLGNLPSMSSLGGLLVELGELDEAAMWLERAAGKGSTIAMYNLGGLELRRGRIAPARYWLRKAADGGDLDAAAVLARLPSS